MSEDQTLTLSSPLNSRHQIKQSGVLLLPSTSSYRKTPSTKHLRIFVEVLVCKIIKISYTNDLMWLRDRLHMMPEHIFCGIFRLNMDLVNFTHAGCLRMSHHLRSGVIVVSLSHSDNLVFHNLLFLLFQPCDMSRRKWRAVGLKGSSLKNRWWKTVSLQTLKLLKGAWRKKTTKISPVVGSSSQIGKLEWQ